MEPFEFEKFVSWSFLAVVSGGIAWGANSIDKLNKNIAILLERVAWHGREIQDHSHRLTRLEDKKK